MTNRITKNGNTLVINFSYQPRLLNAIREIDGRVFNKTKRHWEVPLARVVECVDALEPHGFIIATDVRAAYTAEKQKRDDVAHLKEFGGDYTGALPLYDFQRTGAAFLRSLEGALLADVPGLGKTLQTAAAFENLKDPVLIFVPASLKFNWHDELKKWLPKDKVLVIHGNKQERTELWFHAKKRRAKWVIANYELLLHDFDLIPQDMPWGAIVCDEADRIANPFAQTTKALKKLPALKRVALSGTPISNTPEDLWSITDWLYPRYLGTYKQFREHYLEIHPQWNRVIGHKNLEHLRGKMEVIMLRRKKEDVLKDFPAKTVEHVHFELSKDERQIYDAVRKLILADIRKLTDMDTRSLALVPVKMLRLKQATDHTALIDAAAEVPSSKLTTLKELLAPIVASGEKAIVFTQFAEMSKLLELNLREINPLVIRGEVDAKERKNIADRFQTDPQVKILIMTEAGAYGLNLQAATYVFHYDSPWSVAKIEQREGRAHRVGQEKPVTVYHLVARHTIDEYILKVLKGKQGMSDQVLGDALPDTVQMTLGDIEEILGEKI